MELTRDELAFELSKRLCESAKHTLEYVTDADARCLLPRDVTARASSIAFDWVRRAERVKNSTSDALLRICADLTVAEVEVLRLLVGNVPPRLRREFHQLVAVATDGAMPVPTAVYTSDLTVYLIDDDRGPAR